VTTPGAVVIPSGSVTVVVPGPYQVFLAHRDRGDHYRPGRRGGQHARAGLWWRAGKRHRGTLQAGRVGDLAEGTVGDRQPAGRLPPRHRHAAVAAVKSSLTVR
jgi:hypothetical protein